MKIILIRHAQTKNNLKQYIKDDSKNFSLSEEGIKKARHLFSKLKKAGVTARKIYVAQSKRARMTAEIAFPASRFKIEPGLNEIDKGFDKFLSKNKGLGLMSAQEWENIYNQGKNSDRLKFSYPSGISLNEYTDSVVSIFKKIVAENSSEETIAIVGHNGSIKSIISFVLGGKSAYHHLKIEHADYSEIEFSAGKFYLNFLNR